MVAPIRDRAPDRIADFRIVIKFLAGLRPAAGQIAGPPHVFSGTPVAADLRVVVNVLPAAVGARNLAGFRIGERLIFQQFGANSLCKLPAVVGGESDRQKQRQCAHQKGKTVA